MKSGQSSNQIISIAEQIMKESGSKQGLDKLNEIKKSLEIRSSKTRNNSKHELQKSRNRRNSESHKNIHPSQPITQKRKRQVSKQQDTFEKIHSRLQQTENRFTKTRKRSVTFSLDNNYPNYSAQKPQSPLKQLNHTQKTILKQSSSIKKPSTPKRITQSPKLSQKTLSRNLQRQSLATKRFQPEDIISKKLFLEQSNTKQKPTLVSNEISFNLNLNRLLQTVEKVMQAQKSQKENMWDINSKRKGSMLSEENVRLMKKIGKSLINPGYNEVSLASDFKKRKVEKTEPSSSIRDKAPLKTDFDLEQGHQNDQNQFKSIELPKPSKEIPSLHQSNISKKSQHSITNQNDDMSKQLQSLKQSHHSNTKNLKLTIKELKKDKDWLVQTVQTLLNQNQQLRKLLVKDSN